MDEARIAQPAHEPTTREGRALALFRERGDEIMHLYGSTYRVPSQDGERVYGVEYGAVEYCSCRDHRYRGETCIHLYALGIAMAKGRLRHPEVAAGDPFAAAGRRSCPSCFGGYVTITVEEDGNERDEAVRCKRCHGQGA